jgi:hypothetical protein
VITVHERFNALTEDQKAYFLSVEVDRLSELYVDDMGKSTTIHEPICYYKARAYLPWVFWRWTFESDSCRRTRASNAGKLLYHIYDHIIVDEIVHNVVLTRLMSCQFILDSKNPWKALYLARDDESCQRLRYTSLDALFVQINQVLTESKKKTISQLPSLTIF